MKKIILLFAIVFIYQFIHAQSFTGTGGSIPNLGTNATCFPVNVSGVGIINSSKGLAQVCLTITHTNDWELEIYLKAPDGTCVPLSIQTGPNGVNYTNTCFTATATTAIKFGTPPYTGNFLPEGHLGAVNNGQNADGAWSICIRDVRGGGTGTLNSYTLTFNTTPAPQPPIFPTCANTLPVNTDCVNATPICDFNGLCGSTSGSTPLTWPQLTTAAVFGIENNSFVKFTAAATSASFTIWVNSTTGGVSNGGVQMLFFSGTCGGTVTSYGLYRHILPAITTGIPLATVITAQGLTIGNTYYILIDGYNGATTTFTIEANSGVNFLGITPPASTICAGQNVNLTASGGNGTFAWSPATGLSATSGATVTAAPTATQTYTVSSVTPNGCPITKDVTVTVTPAGTTPVTTFSYDKASACSNDAVNPVLQPDPGFTTGGTFTVSPSGLSINPTTGAINIAASTANDYVITYTVPATGCTTQSQNTFAFSIYTNTTPITGFRYLPNSVCAVAANPTLDKDLAFASGGTYTASPAGLSIDQNTGAINVAASSPGIYTITYAVKASGCTLAGTNTTTFTINSSTTPVTGFNYTPNAICLAGSNPTLNKDAGFTPGGSFTVSPATGLNIDPSTGAVNVAASSAGNYTITYSVAANGCSSANSSSTTITINSNITPVTDFSYSAAGACKNGGNPTIFYNTGFTTGGTFSATPAGLSFNTTTGDIDVAASNPGNYTIKYSITASGCVVAQTSQVTFSVYTNTTPITGFRYMPATVCATATNPALDKDLAFTTGGTFSSSSPDLVIDQNTGAINLPISKPGTYTITYTVNASGCTLAGSGTTTFTINPTTTPVTGFSYSPNNVCNNGANPTLNTVAGFTTGGTFLSAAGLVIDQNTGAINVAASTPGNYTITYSVTSTGCAAAANGTTTFTINANTTPVTGFNYTPNTICENGSNPVLNVNTGFATGGIFSSTNGLAINANTGAINIAASTAGAYTITYSVGAAGCAMPGSSNTTVTITAPATPNTNFSYSPNTVCINGNSPTLNTATGFTTGGTFSSTTGLNINSTTGIIDPATSNAGTYTVTYTITAGGCSLAGSGTTTITINPIITPVTFFGYDESSVCANSSNPNIVLVGGFTTGGTFSATPAGLNIDAATGALNIAGSTPGNYIIKYTVPASGCMVTGFSTFDFTIVANTTPVTNFNYTPNNVCANGANPTINTATGFVTGGTFTATPAGLVINVANGAVNVAASNSGIYTVTYNVPAIGCQLAASSSSDFTITAIPAAAITSFSYGNPVCKNDGNQSPIPFTGFTTGGTYTSTNGLSINSNTGIIDVAASTAGTYTITYTIAATLCSPVQTGTANITINNTPPSPSVTNGRNCGPGIVTLTATGTTGTVKWYDDAALTNLVNTGVSYSPSLTSTTVYRVTETDGLCTSNPSIATATIGEIPQPPFLGTDTSICEGDRLTLNAGSYANYTWQDGSGGSTFVVTIPGTYSVTVANSAGCTNSSSINVNPETDCSDIYFPSAFAPDGKNNLFGPITPNGTIRGITKYSLTIFNRYGQIVFSSTNPTERWDGTFKGKKMGVGTFVWYSTYVYRGRATKKQKGSLVLIR